MTKSKRVAKENKWHDKSRFYKVKGHEYPSVTTILSVIGKPALVAWSAKVERQMVIEVAGQVWEETQAAQMSKLSWIMKLSETLTRSKAHKKKLEEAGAIGSQAHSLIEWNLKKELLHDVGPCPVISQEAQLAVGAWERWRETVSLKPLLCEQAVWSEYWGYAGTMDLLAEVNGIVTMLDWKTGKRIYDEAKLQNVAYRKALQEMGLDMGCERGMIVRLPKVATDQEFEVLEITEPEDQLFHAFLNAFELWKWLNEKEELKEIAPEAVAG